MLFNIFVSPLLTPLSSFNSELTFQVQLEVRQRFVTGCSQKPCQSKSIRLLQMMMTPVPYKTHMQKKNWQIEFLWSAGWTQSQY